jgi:hypothetical protein
MAPTLLLDAGRIARRQAAGDAVAAMLNHQAPAPLRNHLRDNMRAIREKERQLRGRQIMATAQCQARQCPTRAHSMPACGVDHNISGKGARRCGGGSAGGRVPPPAMSASPTAAALAPAEPRSGGDDRPEDASRADVGREATVAANSTEVEASGEEVSLAEFEALADQLAKKHGSGAKRVSFRKDSDGCPAYLRKLMADLADEKARIELERAGPRLPPGVRQVPPDEVATTLEALRKKRGDLEKEFQRLPLKIQTESQKRRQKGILDQIQESDNAIAIFSKPQVLVEA